MDAAREQDVMTMPDDLGMRLLNHHMHLSGKMLANGTGNVSMNRFTSQSIPCALAIRRKQKRSDSRARQCDASSEARSA
eukprot:5446453-Amphidinium_carterae.2